MKPLTMTFLLLSLGLTSLTSHADSDILKTRWADVKVDTVAGDLNHPWGLAFLDDGQMLVSERAGNLRLIAADGTVGEPISGLPEIKVRGQGGLFDIVLSPNFSQNKVVYFAYAEPESTGSDITSTAVARARLENNKLHDVTVIFSQQPKVMGGRHYGGRLAFSADGEFLFIGLGDHGHRQDDVQSLANHTGKLVRIHPDGTVPKSNPFVNQAGALPEIWSYGHRNIQGMAIQPETGQLWAVEHGPQGGDEVNIPQAGLNYGWPIITHGEQYGGGEVGIGFKKDGMEQPIWHWTPSIAVSGASFYQGNQFVQWQGNLLATGLRGQQLARLEVNGSHIIHQETLNLKRRIREVKVAPDGSVYLLTDEPKGAILRLSAVK